MNVNFINKLRRNNLTDDEKKMSWQVISVQTDGVSTNILFGAINEYANRATNVHLLDKKGYNLGNQKINPFTECRGIHTCRCGNNCIKKINKTNQVCKMNESCEYKDSNICTKKPKKTILTLVDPGRSDVFSVCDIDLEKANNPRTILEEGNFWSVSSQKYRHKTGNFNNTYQEHARRNGKYLEFIEDISQEKKIYN